MSTPLIKNFQSYYANFLNADGSGLKALYSSDALFADPIHQITGREAIGRYFDRSKQGLIRCEFIFDEETVSEDRAYFQWRMSFAHRKLGGGKSLELPGVSFLLFEEKIKVHRDYYDMGAMVYEHVPLMGTLARWIKNKISS